MALFIEKGSGHSLTGVELDADNPAKNLVIFEPNGKKVEVIRFIDLIAEYFSDTGKIKSTISYLIDLNQDGKFEILSLVRFAGSENKILITDKSGRLLTSKNSGHGDKLIFGIKKKGLPFFWGHISEWGLSAGAAHWEFYYWNGSSIVKAVDTIQWIGKSGPGMEPHFVYLPGQDSLEIVSDDGKMLWDKNNLKFIRPWKR